MSGGFTGEFFDSAGDSGPPGPEGPAGPAGPSIASQCFVFREGSADAGPVIFGTWAGVIAALATARTANNNGGCYSILFDNVVIAGNMTIPAGGPYDMKDVTWVSPGSTTGSALVLIDIVEGATFTNLRTFTGPMRVTNLATATVPDPGLLGGQYLTLQDRAQVTAGAGSVPMWSHAGTGLVRVEVFGSGSRFGSTPTGTPLIEVLTTGTVNFGIASGEVVGDVLDSSTATAVRYRNAFARFPNAALMPSYTGVLNTIQDARDRTKIIGPQAVPTVTTFGDTLLTDVSAGPVAQVLPAIGLDNSESEGWYWTGISVTNDVGLTIVPAAGETISGSATPLAVDGLSAVTLVSDGVDNWEVVSEAGNSDAGASDCLVYRLGATDNGPVVFGDWDDLMVRLDALRAAANGGCYVIEFDNEISGNAMTIPVGGPYNMVDVTWRVMNSSITQPTTVNIAEGVSFIGLRKFSGRISVNCQATATVPDQSFKPGDVLEIRMGATVHAAGASVPLWDDTSMGSGVARITIADDGRMGQAQSSVPVFSMLAGPTSVVVNLEDGGSTNGDAIETGAAVALTINNLGSGSRAANLALLTSVGGSFNDDALISTVRFQHSPAVVVGAQSLLFNEIVNADASGGGFTITLPDQGGNNYTNKGKVCGVLVGTGDAGVEVAPFAGETIKGSASSRQIAGNGTLLLVSDGEGNWEILSESGLQGDQAQTAVEVQSTVNAYADAFDGVSLVPPVDGDYLVEFGSATEGTNNGTEVTIAIGRNSTTVAQANSERTEFGNSVGSVATKIVLNGLITSEVVNGIFKNGSAAGTAILRDRIMTMVKVGG